MRTVALTFFVNVNDKLSFELFLFCFRSVIWYTKSTKYAATSLGFLFSYCTSISFTWCDFLLSHVNLLFVSSLSVQADDRIRIEKRESAMFEYPTAMRIIKDFYRDTPHSAVENQGKGKLLYLCLLFVF